VLLNIDFFAKTIEGILFSVRNHRLPEKCNPTFSKEEFYYQLLAALVYFQDMFHLDTVLKDRFMKMSGNRISTFVSLVFLAA